MKKAERGKIKQAAPTVQIATGSLSEQLVSGLLHRTRSRRTEYLCRAYLQFGEDLLSNKDLERLHAAVGKYSKK